MDPLRQYLRALALYPDSAPGHFHPKIHTESWEDLLHHHKEHGVQTLLAMAGSLVVRVHCQARTISDVLAEGQVQGKGRGKDKGQGGLTMDLLRLGEAGKQVGVDGEWEGMQGPQIAMIGLAMVMIGNLAGREVDTVGKSAHRGREGMIDLEERDQAMVLQELETNRGTAHQRRHLDMEHQEHILLLVFHISRVQQRGTVKDHLVLGKGTDNNCLRHLRATHRKARGTARMGVEMVTECKDRARADMVEVAVDGGDLAHSRGRLVQHSRWETGGTDIRHHH